MDLDRADCRLVDIHKNLYRADDHRIFRCYQSDRYLPRISKVISWCCVWVPLFYALILAIQTP